MSAIQYALLSFTIYIAALAVIEKDARFLRIGAWACFIAVILIKVFE